MNIQLADVILHIDEALPRERRADIEAHLRAVAGVISVHNPDDRPHLTVVEYDPDQATSGDLLATVKAQGVHAELIGL